MKAHPLVICLILNLNMLAQPGTVIQKEKVYKTINGHELKAVIFYTQQTLNKKDNPAIAFFHGGGWAYGSPSDFHGACVRYAKKGFVTFSFQYRLSVNEDGSVPHPDITPVENTKDARSAMRWLRKNAASLRIDPDRIAAGGKSAGGQLAMSGAMMDEINEDTDDLSVSPAPNALLLFSSNVNTIEAWVDRLLDERRKEIWSISPWHNLKPGMPPTIAFHGKEDCTVPFWIVELFEEKTLGIGNYFQLIAFEDRKHFLGMGNEKYANNFDEEILERTDEFLIKFGFMPEK